MLFHFLPFNFFELNLFHGANEYGNQKLEVN